MQRDPIGQQTRKRLKKVLGRCPVKEKKREKKGARKQTNVGSIGGGGLKGGKRKPAERK